MKPDETIERNLEELAGAVGGRDSFVDDVMGRIKDSSVQFGKKQETNIVLRRILMRNVRFAAAAVIVIAAVLALTVWDKTVPVVYGIEQTIEACSRLRFIHLKCEPAGEGVEEIWAKFNEDGQLECLRMNFPDTQDGPKDVVVRDGKAEVWFKAKNSAVVVQEQVTLERLKMSYGDFDPKLIVEKLYEAKTDPDVQVTITEPQSVDEPIAITSTSKNHQSIYTVDPQTKLLRQIDKYELKDGQALWFACIKYLDYNQPNESVFALELPADVLRLDQTDRNRVVGLEQGHLSNEEAALETARRFWQALVQEDYDTAGIYLEGVPGDFIRQLFADRLQIKVVEVVSVGPVKPHPNPQTGGVVVPCTLKVQRNGEIEEMTFDRLGVRQVYNQPGRWTIFGGL